MTIIEMAVLAFVCKTAQAGVALAMLSAYVR